MLGILDALSEPDSKRTRNTLMQDDPQFRLRAVKVRGFVYCEKNHLREAADSLHEAITRTVILTSRWTARTG